MSWQQYAGNNIPDGSGLIVAAATHAYVLSVTGAETSDSRNDGSPSCTVEASEFRENWTALKRAGAVLLGVSPDDIAAHRKFRASLRLPFALLADTDHTVAKRYRVWGAKSMFGTRYLGMLRTTFVIDEKGYIVTVFENVRTKGHAAQVVSALQ